MRKYWTDIIKPALAQREPPTIPQAIVLRDHQVLLVRRDSPALWELPGGGILTNETYEETTRREVKEETGIGVEIDELLGWYERTGFRAHRSPVFICRPLTAGLRPRCEDVIDVGYFPLDHLPRAMFPWYRSILRTDLVVAEVKPLHRRQHLGLATIVQCVALDACARLGVIG